MPIMLECEGPQGVRAYATSSVSRFADGAKAVRDPTCGIGKDIGLRARAYGCLLLIALAAVVSLAGKSVDSQGNTGAARRGLGPQIHSFGQPFRDSAETTDGDSADGMASVLTRSMTAESGQVSQSALVLSDDFNECSLITNLWELIDPNSDSTPAMVGSFSDDAWLSMSVPSIQGGHDIWLNGNFAPRVMQEVNDTDFEIEVKFESGVSQTYQMLGVLVEEGSDHFLRLEFHSDGVGTRLYAAAFEPDPSPPPPSTATVEYNARIADAGVAPLWMRVQRQGDEWRQYWSVNGVDWINAVTFTHELKVAKVGVYASNADPDGEGGQPAPAYTGYIDYFFNTALPVDPEDGARATLRVDIDGSGTVSVVPDKPSYDCDQVVTLRAEPAEWFVGWSGDLTGTENPGTVIMTGRKSVTASFSYKPQAYLPLVMQPPFSNYLFVGDFESGDLTGFYWNQNKPEVVSSPHPVRAGEYSARSYLHRYESAYSYRTMAIVGSKDTNPPGTPDSFGMRIGEEYWFGFSIYIPNSFAADKRGCDELWWQCQAQPDAGEVYRSPVLAMYVVEDNIEVVSRWDTRRVSTGNTFSGSTTIASIPVSSNKGQWTDWVYHVKWSWQDDGLLELWKDGQLLAQRDGPNCSNDQEGPDMSIGVYKWPWREGEPSGAACGTSLVERLIYVDEIRIAGADAYYDAVAP
jgi:hypothetical protein